jgi:beta-lactamase regulating signal transducer with metallopeptidase domain
VAHTASIAAGLALATVLVGMLLSAGHTVVRARRRHRALLALVAHGDPDVPGTLVLDHPDAAAYCVPGVRSTVVVSAGTVRLLSPYELAAVLDHERAHARERHDLVLLPFASLHRLFPRLRIIARTLDSVAILIEMAADDRAGKRRPRKELATALLRFAAARPTPSPVGTLAADGMVMGANTGANPVLARVQRLLTPDPLPRYVRAVMLAAAAATASIPVTLFFIPH